jgi:serine phosphatase RsbU (regulator of sigma subunit)
MISILKQEKSLLNEVMESLGFKIPGEFLEYCNHNANAYVRWIGFLMGPMHFVFYYTDALIAGTYDPNNEIVRFSMAFLLILSAVLTFIPLVQGRFLLIAHYAVWLFGQCFNAYYLRDHPSAAYTVSIVFIAGAVILQFKAYKYLILTVLTMLLYFIILKFMLKVPIDDSERIGHIMPLVGSSMAGILIALITWRRNLREWKVMAFLKKQHAVLEDNSKKFIKELHLAEKVQRRLLPANKHSDNNVSIDFIYLPSGIIGGDFLDIIPLDENRYGLLIADVSGHGVASALISSMLKMAFYSQGPQILQHPHITLEYLNKIMSRNLNMDFITSIYGIIDIESKEFQFSLAGHENPVIYRRESSEIIQLNNRGRALGISDSSKYKTFKEPLYSGDLIYFFTDGCFESRDISSDSINLEQFINILKKNSALPFEKVINGILKDIYSLYGKVNQEDDITLIVCRVNNV